MIYVIYSLLKLDEPEKVHTSGDVLTGVLYLKLLREISMNKLAVKYFWRECWGERTVESKGLTTDLEIPGAAQNCESKEGWYEIPFRLYLADEPQERVIAPNERTAQTSIDSYEMPKGSLKLKPRGRKDYSMIIAICPRRTSIKMKSIQ